MSNSCFTYCCTSHFKWDSRGGICRTSCACKEASSSYVRWEDDAVQGCGTIELSSVDILDIATLLTFQCTVSDAMIGYWQLSQKTALSLHPLFFIHTRLRRKWSDDLIWQWEIYNRGLSGQSRPHRHALQLCVWSTTTLIWNINIMVMMLVSYFFFVHLFRPKNLFQLDVTSHLDLESLIGLAELGCNVYIISKHYLYHCYTKYMYTCTFWCLRVKELSKLYRRFHSLAFLLKLIPRVFLRRVWNQCRCWILLRYTFSCSESFKCDPFEWWLVAIVALIPCHQSGRVLMVEGHTRCMLPTRLKQLLSTWNVHLKVEKLWSYNQYSINIITSHPPPLRLDSVDIESVISSNSYQVFKTIWSEETPSWNQDLGELVRFILCNQASGFRSMRCSTVLMS